jgi:hypothetical protein
MPTSLECSYEWRVWHGDGKSKSINAGLAVDKESFLMKINGSLSLKRIVYFITSLLICGFVSSQSYSADLCTGDQATIECLMKNAEELYSTNMQLFWDILNKASRRAQDCRSLSDTTRFMKIVRIQRDGAFAEYFDEKMERFCVTNTKCFFNALISMPIEDQDKIIDLLLNPLFVDQTEITEAFYKNKGSKRYKRIVAAYQKKLEEKKGQTNKERRLGTVPK